MAGDDFPNFPSEAEVEAKVKAISQLVGSQSRVVNLVESGDYESALEQLLDVLENSEVGFHPIEELEEAVVELASKSDQKFYRALEEYMDKIQSRLPESKRLRGDLAIWMFLVSVLDKPDRIVSFRNEVDKETELFYCLQSALSSHRSERLIESGGASTFKESFPDLVERLYMDLAMYESELLIKRFNLKDLDRMTQEMMISSAEGRCSQRTLSCLKLALSLNQEEAAEIVARRALSAIRSDSFLESVAALFVSQSKEAISKRLIDFAGNLP